MPQNHRLITGYVDVPPRVPQTVDFRTCGSNENQLIIAAGTPLMLLDALADRTSYRFTLNVIPLESVDQTIPFRSNGMEIGVQSPGVWFDGPLLSPFSRLLNHRWIST